MLVLHQGRRNLWLFWLLRLLLWLLATVCRGWRTTVHDVQQLFCRCLKTLSLFRKYILLWAFLYCCLVAFLSTQACFPAAVLDLSSNKLIRNKKNCLLLLYFRLQTQFHNSKYCSKWIRYVLFRAIALLQFKWSAHYNDWVRELPVVQTGKDTNVLPSCLAEW